MTMPERTDERYICPRQPWRRSFGTAQGPDTRYPSARTGRDRDPYLLETSAPGVFAAGDVCAGSVKRAAAAVGEGSIAVRFVSEYLGRRAGFAAPAGDEGSHPRHR
jgi:hypothetical protein